MRPEADLTLLPNQASTDTQSNYTLTPTQSRSLRGVQGDDLSHKAQLPQSVAAPHAPEFGSIVKLKTPPALPETPWVEEKFVRVKLR